MTRLLPYPRPERAIKEANAWLSSVGAIRNVQMSLTQAFGLPRMIGLTVWARDEEPKHRYELELVRAVGPLGLGRRTPVDKVVADWSERSPRCELVTHRETTAADRLTVNYVVILSRRYVPRAARGGELHPSAMVADST